MSSSFFAKLANGAEDIQKDYLGPTYLYHKNINSPHDLGMGKSGDLSVLAKNIAGIINYTDILVTGKGRASKTGRPLGNKFFLKTGGKCEPKDKKGNVVDRYLYVNNVPDGSLPFISGGSDFRGLIPGIVGNITELNPLDVMGGVAQPSNPVCRKVNLETIDTNNRKSRETRYVADVDLAKLSGCNFPGNRNPVTNKVTGGCKQGFEIMNKKINNKEEDEEDEENKKDPLLNLYNMGFGFLVIYLLYKLKDKF